MEVLEVFNKLLPGKVAFCLVFCGLLFHDWRRRLQQSTVPELTSK